MLGVINGVIAINDLTIYTWVQFVLAISIVFSMWWLFFTIVSDKQCKPGLLSSSTFELLFIPLVIGLGMLGATFNDLFIYYNSAIGQTAWGSSIIWFINKPFFVGYLDDDEFFKI